MRTPTHYQYQVRCGGGSIRLTAHGRTDDILTEDGALLLAKLAKQQNPAIDYWIVKRKVIDGVEQRWEAY